MPFITPIHEDNFKQEVLLPEQRVLINLRIEDDDSYKAMEPVLGELPEQYEDLLKIVPYDLSLDEVLENSNEIAVEYGVIKFPTTHFIKNGHVVTTLLGRQQKEELVKEMDVSLS